ncbi:MAG: hypothetical protein ACRD2E_12430 [Terriglobales bacterium]
MSTLAAVLISAVVELMINALLLAYTFGRLSERVQVLWLAVFNHLGQDAEAAQREYQRIRGSGRGRPA